MDSSAKTTMPKLLRVPLYTHTLEEMFGTLKRLDGLKYLVCLVEDAEDVWLMTLGDVTLERINWLLDRGKISVHSG